MSACEELWQIINKLNKSSRWTEEDWYKKGFQDALQWTLDESFIEYHQVDYVKEELKNSRDKT